MNNAALQLTCVIERHVGLFRGGKKGQTFRRVVWEVVGLGSAFPLPNSKAIGAKHGGA